MNQKSRKLDALKPMKVQKRTGKLVIIEKVQYVEQFVDSKKCVGVIIIKNLCSGQIIVS